MNRTSSESVVSLAGWLFTDLMLVLAIVFIASSTFIGDDEAGNGNSAVGAATASVSGTWSAGADAIGGNGGGGGGASDGGKASPSPTTQSTPSGGSGFAFVSPTTRPGLPTPYPTSTPYPTTTPWPTYTPYPTTTPAPTGTPEPTRTPYPTYTPNPTFTVGPTGTPYPTYTPYPTASPTSEPGGTRRPPRLRGTPTRVRETVAPPATIQCQTLVSTQEVVVELTGVPFSVAPGSPAGDGIVAEVQRQILEKTGVAWEDLRVGIVLVNSYSSGTNSNPGILLSRDLIAVLAVEGPFVGAVGKDYAYPGYETGRVTLEIFLYAVTCA